MASGHTWSVPGWLSRDGSSEATFHPKQLYLLSSHGKGCIEPLFEGAAALEDSGEQEVKQCPELGQLVLQWCACEKQAPRGHIVCVKDLRQLAMVILHAMAFIHDHVLPADLQGQEEVVRGGSGAAE